MNSFDVVVVGGGTAGAVAAIAAGRAGARTVVIEQTGALGGTQTQGWVTPMMPNYLGDFKLNRGINLDIIAAQNKLQPSTDGFTHNDVWYDPNALSLVLDQLAHEAGVKCLFGATLASVAKSNSQISSVTALCRGGAVEIAGKCFIDASGDAELSRLAGAELMGGNEDGIHQPMTLRFTIGGIDMDALRGGVGFWHINTPERVEAGWGEAKDGAEIGDMVREAIAKGVLHEDDLGYFQFFTMNGRPGELAFNAPRISGLDPTNPWDFSRAYQVGREKIYRIAAFVRGWFPGCQSSFVSGIAPLMGIRESHRVVGEYILTAEDHIECRKFSNSIARNRYPIDIHLKTGLDYRKFPPGEYHDIPYGSLVVKGLDNLWVAGRCLSADFVAQSSVRIQPVCRAMGEAAGVAAALCAQKGIAARELDYLDLEPFLDLSLPGGGA